MVSDGRAGVGVADRLPTVQAYENTAYSDEQGGTGALRPGEAAPPPARGSSPLLGRRRPKSQSCHFWLRVLSRATSGPTSRQQDRAGSSPGCATCPAGHRSSAGSLCSLKHLPFAPSRHFPPRPWACSFLPSPPACLHLSHLHCPLRDPGRSRWSPSPSMVAWVARDSVIWFWAAAAIAHLGLNPCPAARSHTEQSLPCREHRFLLL